MTLSLSVLTGQLVLGALDGPRPSAATRAALARGERAGITVFRRNLEGEGLARLVGLAALTADLARAGTAAPAPPLVAIDQEGGRVMRLRAPALELPPMRALGEHDDAAFTERVARAQARELAGLGVTMSFAPVADVHSEPENPVIGDRAFATDPARVTVHAAAFARGLLAGGVLPCAKHFPGHGDTTVDSHLDLPRVTRPRAGLEAIELPPFRALAEIVPAFMSAHVVYEGLDPEHAATLSRAICTDLLRGDLGFRGALMSDDLEMRAIRAPLGESAVSAVLAGCDVVLVCVREDGAAEAHEGLLREAERSPAFRARCEEAYARSTALRRDRPPRPVPERDVAALLAASDAAREALRDIEPRAATTVDGRAPSPVEGT